MSALLDGAVFAGFLVALAAAPFLYGSDDQAATDMLTVFLAMLFLLWAGKTFARKEVEFIWSPIHASILAFLGIALFQILPLPVETRTIGVESSLVGAESGSLRWNTITLDKVATAHAAAKLAMLAGYCFIASTFISSSKRARVTVVLLIVVGFVLSVVGIINKLAPENAILWRFAPDSPSFGPFANRAHFAGFVEMTLPLALAMVFAGGSRADRWPLFAFVAIVMGAAVFISASRAGMVIVLLELVSLPLVLAVVSRWSLVVGKERTTRDRRLMTGMVLGTLLITGAIIGGVAWIGSDPVIERISSRLANDQRLTTNNQSPMAIRPDMWRATLKMIAEHPIVGVGLGAFATAYPRYDRWNGLRHTSEAHNDYLQVLSDTGILGGVVGVFFLFAVFRTVRGALMGEQSMERYGALGASIGCLAILTHSLVDFNLQITSNALLFLTLIALLIRLEAQMKIKHRFADELIC